MCGVNKNTGKMVSPSAECVNFIVWSWYFSALCFHALNSMEPLSLRSTFRGVLNARVMMNTLAIHRE